MNAEEFRCCGYEMIDYVADYRDKIAERQPLPDAKPGFLERTQKGKNLKSSVSKSKLKPPPEKSDTFQSVMNDVESSIMQGISHWQHPNFHAYCPSGNSWSSILANILCNGVSINSATWSASPVATELEMIVLDWVAKFLNIPPFYFSTFSNTMTKGGGAIVASSAEATVLALVSAREHALKKLSQKFPHVSRPELKSKLVCYCNKNSTPFLEKAAVAIADVQLRLLESESDGRLSAETLYSAIIEDIRNGFYPFFMSANLGSGAMPSFDDLMELGPICEAFHIWLHADCEYAGSCFCCLEFKYLTRGLQYTCSMSIDCSKWMLATTGTSILWVKYKHLLTNPLSGHQPTHAVKNTPVEEFQHWGISTTRSFRALKLWMVIRSYGVNGIRDYIRKHCVLAKHFENHVLRDERFEVVGETKVGVCCFAYKGNSDASNHLTQRLLEGLNASHKIFLIPGTIQQKFFIRFSICNENSTRNHIDYAWNLIQDYAGIINRLFPVETNKISKDIENTGSRTVNFMQMSSLDLKSRKIWNELLTYYKKWADINDKGSLPSSSSILIQHQCPCQDQDHVHEKDAVHVSSWAQDIMQPAGSLHPNVVGGIGGKCAAGEFLSVEIDKIFSKLEHKVRVQSTSKVLHANNQAPKAAGRATAGSSGTGTGGGTVPETEPIVRDRSDTT